jgi:hypothetical protein
MLTANNTAKTMPATAPATGVAARRPILAGLTSGVAGAAIRTS